TLNDELIKLPQDQLIKYLSTARKTHYKYRKDSIADYLERLLGIDSRFLFENNKTPLSPEEIKQSQSKAAQNTAQTRRKQTLNQLLEAVKKLVEAGLKATQVTIAELAGKSVRTVKRYWSEITQDKGVISFTSIYSPPLRKVAPSCCSFDNSWCFRVLCRYLLLRIVGVRWAE
ncbi:hypothetical protein H0A36_31010, partial [Endozoicomonas sp. SM1973]